MVYGGTKNYLGENKVWDSNLIVAPERWSGDTCLCAWAGRLHVYSNNTCVRVSDDSPMYYDASVGGAECALDFSNATLAEWVPELHSNTYHTASGALTRRRDEQGGRGGSPAARLGRDRQSTTSTPPDCRSSS